MATAALFNSPCCTFKSGSILLEKEEPAGRSGWIVENHRAGAMAG
jgi:hypothetical protein